MKISNTTLPLPCTPKTFMKRLKAATGLTYDTSFMEAAEYITDLINAAYQDGLDGKGGYPEDPEQMLADVAEESGVEATESLREMMRKLTNWRNEAYREGRRAGEGARG